jgi:ABC-type transport system involved in multi-copper enzyme maturation permease subunit
VTVMTIALLTVREAVRRKVVWALAALTVILLGLDGWGFASLAGMDTSFGQLTSGEARLVAAELLNLVMFALSLVVALGTAFLAGPTLAGEVESGVALAVLARPVRRSAVLVGKWLGLSLFAGAYVVVAGTAQFLVVRWTVGYVPPQPVVALAMLAAEAVVLLTLALLLSSLVSPMASGVVSVGLFGATWVAGIVGGIGEVIENPDVVRIGVVARVVMPTDGLWRGAMHALQDPLIAGQFAGAVRGFPFFSAAAPSAGYLLWTLAWVLGCGALCALSFSRRDV